ncbi:hypothetical protein [Cupriavidus oxalaticus]|uniref:hypothetical protein n=1 Tax=Cupriavidus oxalaticus TaxID=96344 RepID=UPI0031829326
MSRFLALCPPIRHILVQYCKEIYLPMRNCWQASLPDREPAGEKSAWRENKKE